MARRRTPEEENTPLTPEEVEAFRVTLEAKRSALLSETSDVRKSMQSDEGKLPDEVDLAAAEHAAAFAYRLKDREKYLLKKIDKALKRVVAGEYDECESCGAIISKRRLEARPEATLCIACKEEQEQVEKGFLKARERREEEFKF